MTQLMSYASVRQHGDRKITPRNIAPNKFIPGLGLGVRAKIRVIFWGGGNLPVGNFPSNKITYNMWASSKRTAI